MAATGLTLCCNKGNASPAFEHEKGRLTIHQTTLALLRTRLVRVRKFFLPGRLAADFAGFGSRSPSPNGSRSRQGPSRLLENEAGTHVSGFPPPLLLPTLFLQVYIRSGLTYENGPGNVDRLVRLTTPQSNRPHAAKPDFATCGRSPPLCGLCPRQSRRPARDRWGYPHNRRGT